MRLLPYLRSVAGRFFRRPQLEADLDEELRSHIQHRADDLERSGLRRAEAERRARIEFGGSERFKEECRDSIGGGFLETLVGDVRFSLRVLRKSPGLTAVAIATLAMAIGANAIVFGMLNGLILRPLDVPRAESLYGTEYGDGSGWYSYPNYVDLRDRNHSFEDLAAWGFTFAGLDAGEGASTATGFSVSGNYFDVLDIKPHAGRFFHRQDVNGLGSAPFVVLSYGYWHSRFNDDRSVIGRVIRVNKQPLTVIGVAQPSFHGTLLFVSPDFFVPMVNQEPLRLNARASDIVFEVFGHLKPGVTPEQAMADVNTVAEYLRKIYPKEMGRNPAHLSRCGLSGFSRPAGAFVAALMLLAGLILLAACANLGSLFSAHAADRSREMALRLALGAGRTRILRQLLTEALIVALAGGAAGLICSILLLNRLSVWNPFPVAPIRMPVAPDFRVYLVALALALVSGLLFGLVPVRQVLRADPYQIVKAGPAMRAGRRVTVRDVLLVVQIAICAVLVTSSMVALRGMARSLYGAYGFEPRHALIAGVDLDKAGYDSAQWMDTQKRMRDAIETIPGVERVGWVNNYPPLLYGAGTRADIYKDETRDLSHSNVAASPFRYEISPGYFAAAATNLLAGRDFTWYDGDSATPRVAIVNRSFAGKLLGSVTNAVGTHFRLFDGTRVEVVGVVEDGKYKSITEDQQPAMFLPSPPCTSSQTYMIVRSHRNPVDLAPAIRSKLREMDRSLLAEVSSWESGLDIVRFPSRVAAVSLGILGAMGAMLSITGIFGMAAYSVSRRLKELGIRMALGARRREVLGAALGRAFKLLSIGSAAGLVLGILAGRVLASIVYQATSRDPLVLAGVVVVMACVGLVATWIPAQRALSLDPSTLLREE